MPGDTQQADDVLLSFRKRRSTPACYPCSKRKVRCRGGRPCEACKSRGHSWICQDEGTPNRRPRATQAHSGAHLAHEADSASLHRNYSLVSPPQSSISPIGHSVITTSPRDHLTEPSVGKFSAINFVRERLSGAQRSLNRDIHPSIGLGNTDRQPPAAVPLHVGSKDCLVPPTREEVIHYYPPFRDNISVLYPFVYDFAAFEATLHKILEDVANIEPQHVAAALATLALGAQFADTVSRPRREISREFINRATTYLQQANYIFQPNLEVIQALLMIGMALQNCGQSDGAWALLGLNYRLAQTLGLHTLEADDGQGGMLWTCLIWQDALISLRYDRPPLSYGMGIGDVDQQQGLSYYQAVRSCCVLSIDMLQTSPALRVDVAYVLKSVNCLDSMLARCCEHLQPRDMTRSFQQRLQCLALQLHSSLVLAEICRPTFSIPGSHVDDALGNIRQRGLNALVANIEAYLAICTFSNVPLRLWSMMQAAVSCALVLALLDIQNSPSAVRPLLRRLLGALRVGTGNQDPVSTVSPDNLEGVCLMRVKAVGLLESILSTGPTPAVATEAIPPHSMELPLPIPSERLPSADELTWPTDLSLFDRAFADSVLEFDLDPSWYENINWQD